MAGQSDPGNREWLREAAQGSQTAAKALVKDASALTHQAAHLKVRAAETRAESQKARGSASSALSSSLLLSVPEAARRLQVTERALRHVLTEPDLAARLVERTRKVGIYYKFIPLLPPDLMADLPARLVGRKTPEYRPHENNDAAKE